MCGRCSSRPHPQPRADERQQRSRTEGISEIHSQLCFNNSLAARVCVCVCVCTMYVHMHCMRVCIHNLCYLVSAFEA